MASSRIYLDALIQFQNEARSKYTDSKDQELLQEFLRERATPEETMQAAGSLKADAGKKYGSRKVGDTTIPETWISNIMGNINNFVEVGNYAMKGAPESVGLAWFAVKLTLSAIQNNYELYTFFGTGLVDITEIMIIIPHYDRLYDERSKQDWKASPVLEKMFKDIKSTYAAVLQFSFSIKRHLTAGTMARIRHGFKDFFGGSKGKFEAKINDIAVLKKKILEGSEAAFQDKSLRGLESVQTAMTSIQSVVNNIRDFQGTLEQMHQASQNRLDTITKSLEEIKATTKPRTPWDLAVQEFEKHKEALAPLKKTSEFLGAALDEKFPETCSWLFDHSAYTEWANSDASRILYLTGQQGSGKTTLLASVFEQLGEQEDEAETEFISFSCGANSTGVNKVAETVTSVCNTILYQLYELASEDEENLKLLKACNEVFSNSKSSSRKTQTQKAGEATTRATKDGGLPEFADAFGKIASLVGRKVVIILDAVSNLGPNDQMALARKLQDLVSSEHLNEAGVNVRVLVGCRSGTKFYSEIAEMGSDVATGIEIAWSIRDDMGLKLAAALREIPGLSAADQEIAKQEILDKAGPRFNYISDIAIPFVSQPFHGPISEHLKSLPGSMGDTYQEELRKMAPNYVELLRTALEWSLLPPTPTTVEEVMEAFQGIYLQASRYVDCQLFNIKLTSLSAESSDTGESDEPGFPEASHLVIKQLRDASGPFLDVTFNPYYQGHYVYLQDYNQTEAFCFQSVESGHEEDYDEAKTCARCSSALSKSNSLSLSRKQGHLKMALTLLRHLNSPLFHKRAGWTAVTEVEEPATDDAAEPIVENQDSEVKEAESIAPANENPEPVGDGQDQPKDADYDSDDSLDDEDRGEINLNTTDNYADAGENQPQIVIRARYEIQYWMHHIRQAEDLWTPEERANSSEWAALMEELDQFAVKTPEIFKAWQHAYSEPGWSETLVRRPLYVAACFGLVSWAEHLLNQGADANELCEGRNALQGAASSADRPEILKLLLEKGCDVNFVGTREISAFFLWIYTNPRLEDVQLMLEHGADASVIDGYHDSVLHNFVVQGTDPEVLEALLDYGPPERRPDINALNEAGQTPLHLLLWRREVPEPLLQKFVDRGANLDIDDKESIRPLQMASIWGELGVVKILRPGVKEVDDLDGDGDTALHQAAMGDHKECVRYLAETGADPGLANKRGRTALHDAAKHGYKNTMQVLLELGVDPHPLDNHGRSPFFDTCLGDFKEAATFILEELVKRKTPLADINKPTKRRRTPLRQAAEHGFDEIVEKLIQLAEEQNDHDSLFIDEKDTRKGMTALHRAAWRGHVACVRKLLDANANVRVKDANNRTALVLAYEQWALADHETAFEDIISLLIDKDPASASSDPELVAICAVNGSKRLLEQLRGLGTDLSRPDRFGWTPLDLAREFKRLGAEEFLKQQATWANMLPSRWAPNPHTNVLEDGLRVIHAVDKQCCISTDRPLPAGVAQYYFEVTYKSVANPGQREHPVTAIGFCTIGGSAIRFPGWPARQDAPSAKSWGYHGDDGFTFTSTSEDDRTGSTGSGDPYGPGDTVGCGVDLTSRTIWFTRNGVKLDAGFTNVQGRLFPILGFEHMVEIETNFSGPFMWKGETGDIETNAPAIEEHQEGELATSESLTILSKATNHTVETVEVIS